MQAALAVSELRRAGHEPLAVRIEDDPWFSHLISAWPPEAARADILLEGFRALLAEDGDLPAHHGDKRIGSGGDDGVCGNRGRINAFEALEQLRCLSLRR